MAGARGIRRRLWLLWDKTAAMLGASTCAWPCLSHHDLGILLRNLLDRVSMRHSPGKLKRPILRLVVLVWQELVDNYRTLTTGVRCRIKLIRELLDFMEEVTDGE